MKIISYYSLTLLNIPYIYSCRFSSKTTNFERIRTKLRNISNTTSLSVVVKRLLDKAYGDRTLSQDICHKYTSILSNEGQSGEKVMSTAKISTRKINGHYTLPSNNKAAFVIFRDRVNGNCRKAAVDSTYGQFNTITSPLLSYTKVSPFTCNFHNS